MHGLIRRAVLRILQLRGYCAKLKVKQYEQYGTLRVSCMLLKRTTIPDIPLINNNQRHEGDTESCIRVLVLVQYFKYNLTICNNFTAIPLRFCRLLFSRISYEMQQFLENSNRCEQDRFGNLLDYHLRLTLENLRLFFKRNYFYHLFSLLSLVLIQGLLQRVSEDHGKYDFQSFTSQSDNPEHCVAAEKLVSTIRNYYARRETIQ